MKRPTRLLFLLVALSQVPAVSRADGTDDKAREAFDRGEKLFKSQKFTEALTAFEDGYRIKASPAFLFDLALTYQALGNSQQAIDHFRAYLKASPASSDCPAIEAAIAAEQRKLDGRTPAPAMASAPAPAPAPALAKTTPPIAAAPPPPPPPPRPVVAEAPRATPAPSPEPKINVTAPPQSEAAPPALAVTATPEKEPATSHDKATPFYKKWWFWTAAGVAAASAVAIGVGASQAQSGTDPFKEVTWR